MSKPSATPFISKPADRAPAVSVLVPIYNVESYLAQCLDSLVAQTFTDFEVLCINDGSTDSSRAIIQRYLDADARFRVIDKPNSGYGASMNMGLANAAGTYIAILESDDFFEPGALELLIAAAERERVDVVKADFYLHWSVPEPRDVRFHIVDELQIGHTMRPLDDSAVFFRKPSIWSALYRASFLRGHAIDFLETPGASYQDASFNFKVWALAERVTFLGDAILHYRQDNEQSSVNSAAKLYCVCDEYAAMARFIEDRHAGSERLYGIMERMKFDSYMWNYDRLSKDLCPRFARRASEEFAADIGAGHVDFALFEPQAQADLMALVDDPARFEELRASTPAPGKLRSVARLMRLGGIALVVKAVGYKLFKKSPRRLNSMGGAA